MKQLLLNLWNNPKIVLKAAGAVIILLIVLTLGMGLLSNTADMFGMSYLKYSLNSSEPAMMGKGMVAYDEAMDYARSEPGIGYGGGGYDDGIMPPSPNDGYSTGSDAEDFEVTEYNADIRTQDKNDECSTVAGLKTREYVVFESANEHDTGCNFTFKVLHENEAEILAFIEDLDPKFLNTNTYTIKRSVDYVKNEKEILNEKLQSINETLENSLAAYDEITKIATNARDAESLATIIDSKVRLIERLTQERISINEQLNRLEKNMQQQLERLDYTYFYVSVSEDKYLDFESIGDSWKYSIQAFVRETNEWLQAITIGTIGFVIVIVQYLLYGFILLFVVKYVWRYAKKIWHS